MKGIVSMEATTQVLDAIDKSLALSEWISAHHPPKFTHEGTNLLAVAFCSIALDHREAMLLLLRHGARTSAFALARSVYEAGVKGSWAQHCATAEDYSVAFSKGVLPKFETMVRSLGKVPETADVFRRSKDMAWEALSDYAHGGMKQVIRWIGAEGVAPQHSDNEVCELLALMDIYGLIACIGIVNVSGGSPDAHVAKAREVVAAHKRWKASLGLAAQD